MGNCMHPKDPTGHLRGLGYAILTKTYAIPCFRLIPSLTFNDSNCTMRTFFTGHDTKFHQNRLSTKHKVPTSDPSIIRPVVSPPIDVLTY
ncbi:hypothetical protein TNCV_1375711 [Trichonephila clavipes]|nr:hypothetical protein TNCV_1375711 [Trichonephila clavipes]